MSTPVKLFTTFSATDANAPATPGVVMTGTNTNYSQMFSGSNKSTAVSVLLTWTGTPTGTFTLWGSNKANPNEANDSDWFQLAGATFTNPAGAAGQSSVGTTGFASDEFYRTRVKYVNASGAGVLTGEAHAPLSS